MGTSRLLAHAVSDGTSGAYLRAARRFLYDARLQGKSLPDAESIDLALLGYLDDLCYIKGAGFQEASTVFFGALSFGA